MMRALPSSPPPNPLPQDLLKLARYRMVGAVAQSPSARFARMPTTVLAARHMRRTSSASGGGGGGRETGGHGSSVDDELAPAGSAYASGDEMVLTGGSPPPGGVPEPPPRLGQGLPAVAVGAAAAQQPVLLYFGIIDFLQVGAGAEGQMREARGLAAVQSASHV